jgi:RNA polymerase sigma factor (TIGR02999 family)
MHQPSSEATRLIQRIRAGDAAASAELFQLVYGELKGVAERLMSRQGPDQTLQPTALVHEAYVKLVDRAVPLAWNSREHFVRVAARAMRHLLVDRARSRGRRTRGAGGRAEVELDLLEAALGERAPDVLDLEDALERLEVLDEELTRIVELRFFGGLSVEETARVLGLSVRSAERAWTTAKLWLRAELPHAQGA